MLPPKLAPVKSVLVPIYRKDDEKGPVLEAAHRMAKDVGAEVDDREGQNPGAKFFHWERRGVPIVLELGPRDLAAGTIVLKRRDTGTKEPIPAVGIEVASGNHVGDHPEDLYAAAKQRLKDNTVMRTRWKRSNRSCAM